jgi:hypothetical protein
VSALGMALYSVTRGGMSLPARLPRSSQLAAEREGAAHVADAGAGRTRGATLKASSGQGRVVKKAAGARLINGAHILVAVRAKFRSSAATRSAVARQRKLFGPPALGQHEQIPLELTCLPGSHAFRAADVRTAGAP